MRLREGLSRFEVPSRLPVGTVNVYLFTDEPVTLIDTGPNCPECADELVRQMRTIHLSPADVERVLLTHGHVDHHGLAETIRRESGAEVVVPEGDRDMVAAYRETFERRRDRYRDEALRAGAPPATVELVIDSFEYVITLGGPTKVARTVSDGDGSARAARSCEPSTPRATPPAPRATCPHRASSSAGIRCSET